MINESELLWGISTGIYYLFLAGGNAASPQAGALGRHESCHTLPIPHTGRTSVIRIPSPGSLHHVEGACEVPSVGGIWQLLIFLYLLENPLSPPLPMVRVHSNMQAEDRASSEDGGRGTGSRRHNLEFPLISPIAREFEVGWCVCSSRSRPMLEDTFGFLYLWPSVNGTPPTLKMSI